jgi:bifunctional ADP-heptose synthase (sugar kinase/adenylyltransferase)
MNTQRLQELIDRFAGLHVLVIGDFLLDRVLQIDPALKERSEETGLAAHQVVDVLSRPGSAGAVTASLRALGLHVAVIGPVGDDGEGYELRQGLRALDVDDGTLLTTPGRRTPARMQSVVMQEGAPHPLDRIDIHAHTPMSSHSEEALIARLRALAPRARAVLVIDHAARPGYGAITERVRNALTSMVWQFPDTPFLASSRTQINQFERLTWKVSALEAAKAVWPDYDGTPDRDVAQKAGEALRQQSGAPLFVTLGADGMLVFDDDGTTHVPGVPVADSSELPGAGDNAIAAIAASLCAGASYTEAALVGNLAAAATIQQFGSRGMATPEHMLELWNAR